MSDATGTRWWRRNWWGVAAVVPLLVAVVVVSPSGAYEALRDRYADQDEPVHPGGDGWAGYGDARLRLTEFGPAELFDGEGEPFQVPGLAAWQATLTVETGADPEELFGCDLELEDAAGRRYLDAPAVIGSARDATGSGVYAADCTAPFDAEDETGPFETIGYFLLPESTEPVVLRVSHLEQEPAYVRIEVG